MRRYWVRPLLERRPLLGPYERLMAELREKAVSAFSTFVRMDPNVSETSSQVGPQIYQERYLVQKGSGSQFEAG